MADSFSKADQLFKVFGVHRDPENLRKLLNIRMPFTLQESQAERFGKCAHPQCFSYGTIDHPLDLHHVLPRSQSKSRIDDFTNHLYLCGDFFPNNHHKGLHGIATPGKKDWDDIGAYKDCFYEPETCVEAALAKQASIEPLLEFAKKDSMARNLLRTDLSSAIAYASTFGVIESGVVFPDHDMELLSQWREKDVTWSPLFRLKIR